ncbi:MAG: hypothetical protein ABIQ02_06430, partial [Saprospiraceae bacterium]
NNAYVNSKVYATLLNAYKTGETSCPGKNFRLMECTGKHGGRMLIHWTHQNGTSVDLMVPVMHGSESSSWLNRIGMFHYLLKFNEEGQFALGHRTIIDFETIGRHLLALDDAAQKNGLRIRKIIFNTNLHDELFATPSGKMLAERHLNFIPSVSNLVNAVHDDHYHVDFDIVDL